MEAEELGVEGVVNTANTARSTDAERGRAGDADGRE